MVDRLASSEAGARADSTTSRWPSRLLAVAALFALAWIVAISLEWGWRRAVTVDFYPLNGSFQTFNPIRRMAEGQWPARDFDAYLGLGTVYLTRLATLPFGDTFRDSLVGSYFGCALLHAAALFVVARLSRASLATATLLAAGGLALALGGSNGWLPEAATTWLDATTGAIATPGNSLLGFRSFAPFAALAIIGIGWRWFRVGGPGRWRACATWCGVAAGVVVPWSNDYGPVTGVVSLALAFAFAPTPVVAGRRVAFALLSAGVAALAALATLWIATGGGVREWYEYNLVGVGGDQRWYFFHGPGGATWEILGNGPFVVGGAATLASLFFAWRTRRAGDVGLAVLITTSFGAAWLATRASTEERYFFPLYRVLWIAGPVYAARGIALLTPRACASAVTRVAGTALVARAGVVVAGGALAVLLIVSWTTVTRADAGLAEAWSFGQDVPETGGRVPAHYEKAVWLGREIRAECERSGIPRDRRVVSTYTSLLDVCADARSPTRDDYVIHALGTSARARYLADVRAAAPRFATTTRDDFSGWEGWVRKVNWDLYLELIANYDPFERTSYLVLWRRRATPRSASNVPVTMTRAEPDGRGRIQLTATIDTAFAARGTQIVEIELTSERGFLPTASTSWLSGSVLVGVDLHTTHTDGRFGLPSNATRWRFPVEVTPGTETRVRLVSRNGEPIALDSATARVVVDKDTIDAFRLARLCPSSRTDAPGLDRGVRADGVAGFVVTDPGDLMSIGVGARLRFASSGERTITSIDGVWVNVDGPPLSPGGDGHPHAVEVLPP